MQAFKIIKPTHIFHLAASSSPAQSFKEPIKTLRNNIFGQINILDAAQKFSPKSKILIVGSAEEYGQIEKGDKAINEEAILEPSSPYAVSKVAQDFLGYQYYLHSNMHVVRVRPFNHIGPRQSPLFVVPAFASQIAQIEQKGAGTIMVGNLNAYRDFTDVRDMVRAYLLALEKGEVGQVYNIGSGKLVKIKNILDMLIAYSQAKINVKIDKNRYSKVEVKAILCDFTKFKKATGWQPTIPLKTTLFDTINYERSKQEEPQRPTTKEFCISKIKFSSFQAIF
ncbi:GDP-mannose 4,6-dehydratase [Candidatus Curtissbacteria bacterium]|nr:GDP-mannose 4,6-dehydratase [Candidatus Curtissbacteria bacterium]